jgi:transcriptional regulator with XRE-family HTH domain
MGTDKHGLSHDEIAKVCHCSLTDVVAWEEANSFPTLAQVSAIANKCKRPLAFLFLPEPPNIPAPPPEYRTLHSINAGEPSYGTSLAIRTAQYVQEISIKLAQELGETLCVNMK